jgi:hypothetical protein
MYIFTYIFIYKYTYLNIYIHTYTSMYVGIVVKNKEVDVNGVNQITVKQDMYICI